MDIYRFAMEMEDKGRKHYLDMIKEAPNKAVAKVFQILAEEELKHYQHIEKLSNDTGVIVESENLTAAESAFKELLIESNKAMPSVATEAYIRGMQLEDVSIEFYKEQAAKEKDPSVRIVFLKLYFEEKKHKLMLENILELLTESGFHNTKP